VQQSGAYPRVRKAANSPAGPAMIKKIQPRRVNCHDRRRPGSDFRSCLRSVFLHHLLEPSAWNPRPLPRPAGRLSLLNARRSVGSPAPASIFRRGPWPAQELEELAGDDSGWVIATRAKWWDEKVQGRRLGGLKLLHGPACPQICHARTGARNDMAVGCTEWRRHCRRRLYNGHWSWRVLVHRWLSRQIGWSPSSVPRWNLAPTVHNLRTGWPAEPGRTRRAARTGRALRRRMARTHRQCWPTGCRAGHRGRPIRGVRSTGP
jgi:hypothetical protein